MNTIVVKDSKGKFGIKISSATENPNCKYDAISLFYEDSNKRFLKTRIENILGVFDCKTERFLYEDVAYDIKLNERNGFFFVTIPRKLWGYTIKWWHKRKRIYF